MKKGIRTMVLVGALLGLTACRETALQHQLSEEDANEMIVLLYHNGINAEKVAEEKNQEVTWNVEVSPADEDKARELLVLNHLPRKPSLGLDGVCQDEGLIPTPKREKCRELLAYKGELINSLEKITGVVDADVVLTIPDREDYLEEGKNPPKPTASVIVKGKTDASGLLPVKEEQIQRFVANAVPGMDPGNVTVILTATSLAWQLDGNYQRLGALAVSVHENGKPHERPTLGASLDVSAAPSTESEAYTTILGIQIHEESIKQFKKVGLIAMVVFLVISGLLIFVLYMQIRSKRQREDEGAGRLAPRLVAGDAGVDHLLGTAEVHANA